MPDKTSTQHNISLFLWVFVALNAVFAYYEITFFWGNHDWDWVKGTTQVLQLNTGMFEGRYAKFILNVALFGGQILPLLNTIIAFALLAAGQVLLVNYWGLKTLSTRMLTVLIPALSPFILGWLFFPINILGNFSAVALVAGGLILTEKAGIWHKIAAIVCFITALGVYPSAIEMMLLCWAARQILLPPTQTKQMFSSLIVIIAALIIFKLILSGLNQAGLVYMGHYNMQTISLSDMLTRLPQTIALMFSQMFVTLPFLPFSLKGFGIMLVVLAFYLSARKLKTLFLWGIMLGATVLSTFLTAVPEETAYMPRVNFYGLNYLYAVAIAVILKQKKIYRNLGLVLGILYLLTSVKQNLEAQKVWRFGKMAEERLIERTISRIEKQNPPLPITPVIAGEMPLRPRYYANSYMKAAPYLLEAPLMVRHIPSGMFNFYAPTPLFTAHSQISTLTPELYNYLKTAARPWPAPEGMYIDNNYVILLLTQDGIKAIQDQLP